MVRRKKLGITEKNHSNNPNDLAEDELYDSTKYGEIIPSLFGWTTSEEQEERVDYLMEISEELAVRKRSQRFNRS
ncbi:MAG: hypothetical protein PWQ82_107 [Thermosediminibacterales bacterium]|nr:hypothetical protein [Thermosediminibacterales bacterium]